MYVDLLFLFILYSFSVSSLLLGIYLLWVIGEMKRESRRRQIAKRLDSIIKPIKDKPKTTWPPK